jgi:hypothetical protein
MCFFWTYQKLQEYNQKNIKARHQWLTPIILATWEVESGRIEIQGQPWQRVHKTTSPK